MDISIIIVNYNTCMMTHECINSIFEHTKDVTFEVILIDNKSTDGSKEFFEFDSRIRYIYSFENMGFGRANNIGMMLSKGDFVFILNSDTILLNNAIKIFYDTARNDKYNFYGSWLLDQEKKITTSFGEEPTISSMLSSVFSPYLIALGLKKRSREAHSNHPHYGKNCEVGYISGANMFFARQIFEKFEAFDYRFFMYYEEAEWQKRLKKYGVKSYIIDGPKIIHLNGGSDIFKSTQNKYYSINPKLMMRTSRKYFLSKHYNIYQSFTFRIIYFILELPLIIFSPHYRLTDKVKYIFK